MTSKTNSMATAWLTAAQDLGIRVQHPFTFPTKQGSTATTQGVYLPDFGSEFGTLLPSRFDADSIADIVVESEYFCSWLNPHHYEPYDRESYICLLNDFGWFSDMSRAPAWFSGGFGKHGGAG